jgi:hypothetical protein
VVMGYSSTFVCMHVCVSARVYVCVSVHAFVCVSNGRFVTVMGKITTWDCSFEELRQHVNMNIQK